LSESKSTVTALGAMSITGASLTGVISSDALPVALSEPSLT
jgi:hypothetical protein